MSVPMIDLKLRLIYAAHMLLPLSLVDWHLGRLAPETLARLRARFAR